MGFIYQRVVQFQDTDAAGVVYFANVLAMCHEAYEASLAALGINLRLFFSGGDIAVPITHSSADFFRPQFCGDRLSIYLTPKRLSDSEFEIAYEVFLGDQMDKATNKALTRHVCIDPRTRKRKDLPEEIVKWLHRWEPKGPIEE